MIAGPCCRNIKKGLPSFGKLLNIYAGAGFSYSRRTVALLFQVRVYSAQLHRVAWAFQWCCDEIPFVIYSNYEQTRYIYRNQHCRISCRKKKMDYLLTWNCTHLANEFFQRRLVRSNQEISLKTPFIVTPEALLAIEQEEI